MEHTHRTQNTKMSSDDDRGNTFPCDAKLDIRPRQLDCSTQFHAYFCQDVLDSKWTKEQIDFLEDNYGFVCAEYNRECLIGETILDVMSTFIFTSDRIVIVLSQNFLNSKSAMFQLHLAIQYAIDHSKNNIVTLHIDDCELPRKLLPFKCIDAKKKTWREKFLTYLNSPVPKMLEDICTKGTHVSVDDLCKTGRSVMSEPATLHPSRGGLSIPDDIRQKIKIWHRSKSIDESLKRVSAPPEALHDAAKSQTTNVQHEPVEESKTLEYSPEQMNKQQASLLHALKIRIDGKRVFEARDTRIAKTEVELTVHRGDVLERLHEEPFHGNLYECENAQGKTGLVPVGLLAPSWHLIPSSIVKLMRQPIAALENENFKGELLRLGHSYYIATDKVEKSRHDTMNLSVQKGDILFRQSEPQAGRAVFRNCRNETGYLGMSYVKLVDVSETTLERSSNTSIGSEGYGSETGDNACSNA